MSKEEGREQELTIEEIAKFLNHRFERGISALDNTEVLPLIKRPILVDFNCVLANNLSPIIGSPYAKDFLDELETIGDIVIVTAAEGWEGIKGILQSVDCWNDKRVLMTQKSWYFTFGYDRYEWATNLRDKYIAMRNHPEITAKKFTNTNRAYSKKVAPLFMKTYDIPLIDDLWENTHENPGIFGIQVEPYEPGDYPNYDGSTLQRALETVRDYYQNLKPSH